MSQQLGSTPPTIDIRNQEELRWWAKELGVSEDQVRGAVSRVGDSAQAVRQALQASAAAQPSASGGSYSGSARAQSWDEHNLLPNRGLIDDGGKGATAARRLEASDNRDRVIRWALIAMAVVSAACAVRMMRRRGVL